MLELKQIRKDYPAGTDTVHALKGISHRFDMGLLHAVAGPRCSCWISALPRPRARSGATLRLAALSSLPCS